MNESELETCPVCGRILASQLEEWDDSQDLLCDGPGSPGCEPPTKKDKQEYGRNGP